jgi:hypothetical protein
VHLGYEPLQAGLVFLPFSRDIIIASQQIAMTVHRVRQKHECLFA